MSNRTSVEEVDASVGAGAHGLVTFKPFLCCFALIWYGIWRGGWGALEWTVEFARIGGIDRGCDGGLANIGESGHPSTGGSTPAGEEE